jgi:alanyl-tRNA synthetase
MIDRLYFHDQYLTSFETRIVERLKHGRRTGIILERTYFYPTSGGQAHDTGMIDGCQVLDVFVRNSDQAIVHTIENEIWADEVLCHIDWPRRFDQMQNHTGQHILSQAFLRVTEVETVGFHLGTESVTIDLPTANIEPAQVEEAELLANQIVWENRPVTARIVSQDDLIGYDIRRLPDIDGDDLRLVEIEDFDLTACGGTHVRSTGEVGLVKIVKLERRKDSLRVDFRCGQRALFDYRLKNRIMNRLAAELTTGLEDIESAVSRLREASKQSRRHLQAETVRLLSYEATQMVRQAKRLGSHLIINEVFEGRDPVELRLLANQLLDEGATFVFLGQAGPKSHLVLARAEGLPGDMNLIIKSALQILGSTSGGGTAALAQGGGPAADHERVALALNRAEKLLLAQLQLP